MTRTIPDYLRLHIPTASSPRRRRHNPVAKQDLFWKTFAEATGWAMIPGDAPSKMTMESVWQMDSMASIEDAVDGPTISRDAATELAKAAYAVFEELSALHKSAEEAIPSGTSPTPENPGMVTAPQASPMQKVHGEGSTATKPVHSNAAIESAFPTELGVETEILIRQHLTHARIASNASACVFYMLDQQCESLNSVASSCRATSVLSNHARPITSSLADIESLTGNFVAVDSVTAKAGFAIPESFPAAACVEVKHREVPVGTLWLFFEDDREAGIAEEATMRLTASLIGTILMLQGNERQLEKTLAVVRPLKAAAQWQRKQLTLGNELAEGWQCGGWVQSPQALASSWFLWDILPDGMLAFAMAEANGTGLDGALIAATARSAWQAHAGYRHDPTQLLQRLNDTLWQTNSISQPLSILYAQLNPDTGEGAFASAGNLTGLITSRFGYRPLMSPTAPLGSQIEATIGMHQLRLTPGETILLHTPGLAPHGKLTSATSQAAFQQSLAYWWRNQPDEPLQLRLDRFRKEQSDKHSIFSDRTMIAIERLQSNRSFTPAIR